MAGEPRPPGGSPEAWRCAYPAPVPGQPRAHTPDDTLDVLAPGAPYLHLCNALCQRFDAHRDR
ncbi:hypothetical protein ABZW32_39510, partial [Streptomyces sp. NPDC004667]|uniref:hypothetical protein n=1 Tax=Streptomyces sp. NPDC004667 TaxID=3154285 RepID=UPI0033A5E54C